MFTAEISTANEQIRLIVPNVERDAPLSVEWLGGNAGRHTLRMMGVPERDNHPSTLDDERQRIQEFIDGTDQLNWMVEVDGSVVGSVWVDLEPDGVPGPAISIMIGDLSIRGRGVGQQSVRMVIDWLVSERQYEMIYARHLIENTASAHLLEQIGFKPIGNPYTDADNLCWQNAQWTHS